MDTLHSIEKVRHLSLRGLIGILLCEVVFYTVDKIYSGVGSNGSRYKIYLVVSMIRPECAKGVPDIFNIGTSGYILLRLRVRTSFATFHTVLGPHKALHQ